MKCKPQRLSLSKSEREILDREIRAEMLRLTEEYEKAFDIILASTLNRCFGIGRKRFKRLYNQIIDERLELRRMYSDDKCSDDKIDIFVMEQELKRKGINITEIFDEIIQERKEDIEELNGSKKYE
jgi:hypothetical protein